jgi:hypothetical protein
MASRGIPVLPIHDSFLVEYRHAETLTEEMHRAYREQVGAEIAIEAKKSFIDDLVFDDHHHLVALLEQLKASAEYVGFLSRAEVFVRMQ